MKHIINKMFGNDHTEQIMKLTAMISASQTDINSLSDLSSAGRKIINNNAADIVDIKSKLEKTISALDIMINRHNDLSKEFKEYKEVNKAGKVKYIPEQKK